MLRLAWGIRQWGNGGSCFIPEQIGTAKKYGKAYYILPGQHACTSHAPACLRETLEYPVPSSCEAGDAWTLPHCRGDEVQA